MWEFLCVLDSAQFKPSELLGFRVGEEPTSFGQERESLQAGNPSLPKTPPAGTFPDQKARRSGLGKQTLLQVPRAVPLTARGPVGRAVGVQWVGPSGCPPQPPPPVLLCPASPALNMPSAGRPPASPFALLSVTQASREVTSQQQSFCRFFSAGFPVEVISRCRLVSIVH